MNQTFRQKIIHKLPALLLAILILLPGQALAKTYGSGLYGGTGSNCGYGQTCAEVKKSFFDKYGWIFFLAMIIASLIWLIILLAQRRNRKNKETPTKKA